MKNRFLYIILVISAVTTACFKDDEPIVAHFGKVTTIKTQIEQYQSYYDFETDSVVKYFLSDAWTLGFGCGENDLVITTNSGDNWFVLNTHQTSFDNTVDYPKNKIWDYDKQAIFPDSTAIDGWFSIAGSDTVFPGMVYLIGKFTGTAYSKIFRLKILKAGTKSYEFSYKDELTQSLPDTASVQKIDTKNFVFYSLDDFSTKDLEPDLTNYDISFGPYYDTATQLGVTAPYLVRGVFLNKGSSAIVIPNSSIESVSLEQLSTSDFSERRDIIGYNWKNVVIDPASGSAAYKVRMNNIYVVKTQEGNYFKFRFVSYALNGNNGYPSFEVEKMN
jgi:hypothetical protein